MTARRKGAPQKTHKKKKKTKRRQKLLITSQKTHFCGSLCSWPTQTQRLTHTHTPTQRGKNSCSHFICNSECGCFCSTIAEEGRGGEAQYALSSIAPLAQVSLIIIFTNSSCDLREGLSACPRFDGLATQCKLCLCSSTSAKNHPLYLQLH